MAPPYPAHSESLAHRTRASAAAGGSASVPSPEATLLAWPSSVGERTLLVYDGPPDLAFRSFLDMGAEHRENCFSLLSDEARLSAGWIQRRVATEGAIARVLTATAAAGKEDASWLPHLEVALAAFREETQRASAGPSRYLLDLGRLDAQEVSRAADLLGRVFGSTDEPRASTFLVACAANAEAAAETERLARLHDVVIVGGSRHVFLARRPRGAALAAPPVLPREIPRKTMMALVRALAPTVFLLLLRESPACGRELVHVVNERFGVLLSQVGVYTVLYDLERRGLVERVATGDHNRVTYAVSSRGAAESDRRQREVTAMLRVLLAAVDGASDRRDGEEAAP